MSRMLRTTPTGPLAMAHEAIGLLREIRDLLRDRQRPVDRCSACGAPGTNCEDCSCIGEGRR